jgi:hypothetical protein
MDKKRLTEELTELFLQCEGNIVPADAALDGQDR